MTIQDLVKTIKSHGFNAKIENGKLMGETAFTKNGELFYQWEEITPNIKSVRDWLGY